MIGRLASNTCSPWYGGTAAVNFAPSSTVSSVGMPAASHASWSSSPKAGAMCTTPVPSSVVTWSLGMTW